MLKTSLGPLQQAIFTRLSTDTALTQRIKGVYDEVGKNTPFPYCTIGDLTVNPFETKTTYGENITIVLHCWSQYRGKKEAFEILNLMLQAITKAPFVIEGFSLIKMNIEPSMQVFTDIDGKTRHGILRLRFHINN